MKYISILLFILTQSFIPTGYTHCARIDHIQNCEDRIDSLLKILYTPTDSYIMVVAHRGDCTRAPENSLEAIRDAINAGADILEIDVRLTKDRVPVLMHDKTINRTTTGKGKVSNWDLDSLNELFLTDRNGKVTPHKIPTLEEALLLSRGKILINLDKCTMHLNRIVKYLKKTNTLHQVIIKIRKNFHKTRLHKRCLKRGLIYIPKIEENNKRLEQQTKKFTLANSPVAFDINITKKDSSLRPIINRLKKESCRIWVNTTIIENVRNYKTQKKAPCASYKWDWAVKSGANIIITDEPALLIDYLESKGLRKIDGI